MFIFNNPARLKCHQPSNAEVKRSDHAASLVRWSFETRDFAIQIRTVYRFTKPIRLQFLAETEIGVLEVQKQLYRDSLDDGMSRQRKLGCPNLFRRYHCWLRQRSHRTQLGIRFYGPHRTQG